MLQKSILKELTYEVKKSVSQDLLKIGGQGPSNLAYEWLVAEDTLNWSGNIKDVLGYEPGEIPATMERWMQLIHPEDVAVFREALGEHRTSKNPINFKYRIKHKNGSWRYWSASGLPVLDAGGFIYKWIGICHDLTERRQVEEALRENERKYRTILENIEDGYYEVDISGKFIFANDSLCKIFGTTEHELIGKEFKNFTDRETATKGYKAFNRVYTTGKPAKFFDWAIVTKNGNKKYVEASISPMKDGKGRPTGFQGILRDISERKKDERILRETEASLKEAQKLAHLGSWSLDLATNSFTTSEEMMRIFRYHQEHIGFDEWKKFIHPDDREKVETALKDAVKGKRPYDLEFRIVLGNGDIRVLHAQGKVIRDRSGKPLKVMGTGLDITGRKQAEKELRESEKKYRTLAETSPDGIVIVQNGEIKFVNESLLNIFGYETKEDMEGHDFSEFISPDYREMMIARVKERERGKAVVGRYEFKAQHKDGTEFDADISVGLLTYQGKAASQAIIRDISEQKQASKALHESEQRYRLLIEESPLGIALIRKDGKYLYLNPTFTRIFGYTLEDIPSGKEWWHKAYPDENKRKEAKAKWIEDLKKHRPGEFHPEEFTVTCKDGSEKVIHFRSVTMDNGEQFVTYEDITEIKLAEEERAKLEARLLQAQKMETIGILAGGVAHDLNNILSGIVSYPELILMDLPEGSPLRKPILTMQKSGEKAAVVVQDLLTLARRGVTVEEVINLDHIISEQLKSPEFEKLKSFHPNVEFDVHLEKDLLNVKGSAAHLSKTVMNLISNAAEAMPAGGKIFLSTENVTLDRPVKGYEHIMEGDYVTVTVADSGIGISKKEMDRIFEPFYTKKVMGRSGTGLGMAVVWGTVKDHSGYIDVQSTKGKGTTFTLYFPVTREEVDTKTHSLIQNYMGRGEPILVVDDVEEQREIASALLKKLGYSVVAAGSGEEAIKYLKDESADLVILDMIMDPGIDGLETYRRILEINPRQKAIITSGFSETDRVKEARKLGARTYLKKPYALEKIGLAVQKALASS